MVNWEAYRYADDRIDLIAAYKAVYFEDMSQDEHEFLTSIMEDQPIKSRQVAALALNVAAMYRKHYS